MSENDFLQNQKYYHDEDQNDKDSGTHHHAPFLLGPLSLQNRRTKILDHKWSGYFSLFQATLLGSVSEAHMMIIKAQESACSKQ